MDPSAKNPLPYHHLHKACYRFSCTWTPRTRCDLYLHPAHHYFCADSTCSWNVRFLAAGSVSSSFYSFSSQCDRHCTWHESNWTWAAHIHTFLFLLQVYLSKVISGHIFPPLLKTQPPPASLKTQAHSPNILLRQECTSSSWAFSTDARGQQHSPLCHHGHHHVRRGRTGSQRYFPTDRCTHRRQEPVTLPSILPRGPMLDLEPEWLKQCSVNCFPLQ